MKKVNVWPDYDVEEFNNFFKDISWSRFGDGVDKLKDFRRGISERNPSALALSKSAIFTRATLFAMGLWRQARSTPVILIEKMNNCHIKEAQINARDDADEYAVKFLQTELNVRIARCDEIINSTPTPPPITEEEKPALAIENKIKNMENQTDTTKSPVPGDSPEATPHVPKVYEKLDRDGPMFPLYKGDKIKSKFGYTEVMSNGFENTMGTISYELKCPRTGKIFTDGASQIFRSGMRCAPGAGPQPPTTSVTSVTDDKLADSVVKKYKHAWLTCKRNMFRYARECKPFGAGYVCYVQCVKKKKLAGDKCTYVRFGKFYEVQLAKLEKSFSVYANSRSKEAPAVPTKETVSPVTSAVQGEPPGIGGSLTAKSDTSTTQLAIKKFRIAELVTAENVIFTPEKLDGTKWVMLGTAHYNNKADAIKIINDAKLQDAPKLTYSYFD